jgi:hypothetical protein
MFVHVFCLVRLLFYSRKGGDEPMKMMNIQVKEGALRAKPSFPVRSSSRFHAESGWRF